MEEVVGVGGKECGWRANTGMGEGVVSRLVFDLLGESSCRFTGPVRSNVFTIVVEAPCSIYVVEKVQCEFLIRKEVLHCGRLSELLLEWPAFVGVAWAGE